VAPIDRAAANRAAALDLGVELFGCSYCGGNVRLAACPAHSDQPCEHTPTRIRVALRP